MGLDAVDLVIQFEDTFGVSIPDEAAARMVCPRDVIEYVMARVEKSRTPSCASQRGFHLVRREFMRALPVAREQIRLQSLLPDLVPREVRKQTWPMIGDALGANEWPELVRPRWLFNTLALLTVVTGGAATLGAVRLNSSIGGWAIALCMGSLILVNMALAYITRPFRTEFAAGMGRVEDLVRWIVAKSPGLVVDEPRHWTRERVALVVRQIIIDEMGVTEYDEDWRFVEDIGVN